MNAIPDLVPLHDNRPGVRALVQVEIRDPLPAPAGQGEAGTPGASCPTLDFIASTATLDRYHEIIEPAGWRLDSYRRNPVFQNAHNYGDILFTLGKALITEVRLLSVGGALSPKAPSSQPQTPERSDVPTGRGTLNSQPSTCLFLRVQFATEVNPMARIAYGLYKGGFLNAVSVGFIPLRWEDGAPGRAASPKGPSQLQTPERSDVPTVRETLSSQPSTASAPRRRYLEQELLEVSAVAIPANPDALALGLKSGAVAKSDLQATLELLSAVVGPFRRNSFRNSQLSTLNSQPSEQLSTLNSQLVQIARELRRVMHRA